jgi:hypothetical protein
MSQISISTLRKRAAACRRRLAATLAIAALAALVGGAATAGTASADPTSPPLLTILTHGSIGKGDFFAAPTGATSTYANGPEILDQDGNVVWFHPVPAGQSAADFRTQTYQGKPVLTWWQGTGLGGLAKGTDYIYNDKYQQVATVQAGNGLSADGHEFLITPQNTALILAYTTKTADLTSIGGPANQTVIDGVVQEIDIRTGKVLFQWNAADHVPYSQSEQPLPKTSTGAPNPSSPWDWFHINAVKLDTDGNLLIDARNTWTSYKVDRHSGQIIWQLGGKASRNNFQIGAAPGQILNKSGLITAWQHDFEAQGHGIYTFFDNESAGIANTGVDANNQFGVSRAVTVKVDPFTHTATLLSSFNQPEGLLAPSQGNSQRTADGDTVVGWGSLPYFSEFAPNGQLLYNAQWPTGVNSYRVYKAAWPPAQGGGHGPGYHPGGDWPHYDPGHGHHHH